MAVVIPAGGRRRPVSFYEGSTYTPDTIGSWVATDKRTEAWNTIGKALEGTGDGQTVDHLMTAEEVLRLAHLDFDVKKVPVQDSETGVIIPKLFSTYMPDDAAEGGRFYFGGVSDKYEEVRPSQALSVFDHILRKHVGAHYSAGWAMREKSQMGVTIEFPEQIVIDPKGANDTLNLYGLGWNSFDGSTGLGFGATAVRWFCLNQLTPTIQHMPRSISMKHTRNVGSAKAILRAQEAIGITLDWAKAFDEIATRLFQTRVSDPAFETMLSHLKPFTVDTTATELVQARVNQRRDEAMAAWRAPHNANITKTAWGAFNVMTEWADWGRNVVGSARSGADSTRQRAIGTLVGGNVNVFKNEAWKVVMAA